MVKEKKKEFYSPESIIKEIATGKIRPVYLLLGEDRERGEAIVQILKEKLVSPGMEAFDYETVYGKDIGAELPIALLIQRTRQPAFSSKRRLMVIRDIQVLSEKLNSELFTGLKHTPNSATAVVFYSEDYRTPWGGLNRRIANILQGVGEESAIVDCQPPQGEGLVKFLQVQAKELGLRITPEVLEFLVATCGEDTGVLKGELRKLGVIFSAGETVDENAIRRYAGMSRAFELGEYVRLVTLRDTVTALKVLRRLEKLGEEPVTIIAWLTHALIDLLRVKTGEWSIGRLWRAPQEALNLWSEEGINRALEKLYLIDVAILTGHPEPFVLIDMWTVGIGQKTLDSSHNRSTQPIQEVKI
ncbi:MAG: DNA polymerase III subunit delta [candidate division WOR-3 bacterium]